jgi:hypothetical protein
MTLPRGILTLITLAAVALTVVFTPWKTWDSGYVFAPLWRPVPYDEGGALIPFLLGVEWLVIIIAYLFLFRRLRRYDNAA